MKGLIILLAILYIIFNYAEFKADYESPRVLPECNVWPEYDCHKPKYKN